MGHKRRKLCLPRIKNYSSPTQWLVFLFMRNANENRLTRNFGTWVGFWKRDISIKEEGFNLIMILKFKWHSYWRSSGNNVHVYCSNLHQKLSRKIFISVVIIGFIRKNLIKKLSSEKLYFCRGFNVGRIKLILLYVEKPKKKNMLFQEESFIVIISNRQL